MWVIEINGISDSLDSTDKTDNNSEPRFNNDPGSVMVAELTVQCSLRGTGGCRHAVFC